MFGAKKVSPACPILCIARASVAMTWPIAWIRDLRREHNIAGMIIWVFRSSIFTTIQLIWCLKQWCTYMLKVAPRPITCGKDVAEEAWARVSMQHTYCTVAIDWILLASLPYISTKVDSWWSCHSVQCLRPPLVGRNLQTINARSRVPNLCNLILRFHSSN